MLFYTFTVWQENSVAVPGRNLFLPLGIQRTPCVPWSCRRRSSYSPGGTEWALLRTGGETGWTLQGEKNKEKFPYDIRLKPFLFGAENEQMFELVIILSPPLYILKYISECATTFIPFCFKRKKVVLRDGDYMTCGIQAAESTTWVQTQIFGYF